jgi:hypothetical protein
VAVRPFGAIIDLARVMRRYPEPWFISGGWAIDLFVGRVTRAHEDVEVGAYFPHQAALRRHLADWEMARIRGVAWEPWNSDQAIELPEFQAQARSDRLAPRVFDIFLNPLDGDNWLSRRHPELRVRATDVFARTIGRGNEPRGVPYLVPEVQLLYKAKYHRSKDETDFDAAVGLMTPTQSRWLRETLEIHHPGDPWIGRL